MSHPVFFHDDRDHADFYLVQDEQTILNQIREREVVQQREAEAREREAELARRRLEEERMAREEEERRQAEREKALGKKKGVGRGEPSSSGVRGVRGTRASMRARGVATGIARGVYATFLAFLAFKVILTLSEGTTTTSGPGKTSIPRPSSRTTTVPARGRGRG